MAKKITILGTNILKIQTGNAVSNRDSYTCANPKITSGQVEAPSSLEECYELFPEIKIIADALEASFGLSGASGGVCICGLSGASGLGIAGGSGGFTLIFSEPDPECVNIYGILGKEWAGCFWPDPMATFSCNCPLYGDMFENFLKYRLGSATFWDTPIDVPIQRQDFIESIKELIEITIGGDLSQRPGDIVYVKMDDPTGLATLSDDSPARQVKTGYYYIMRAKNVIKNDGGHTTILSLSTMTNSRFYKPYAQDKPYESI
jgi:hypothetical protein